MLRGTPRRGQRFFGSVRKSRCTAYMQSGKSIQAMRVKSSRTSILGRSADKSSNAFFSKSVLRWLTYKIDFDALPEEPGSSRWMRASKCCQLVKVKRQRARKATWNHTCTPPNTCEWNSNWLPISSLRVITTPISKSSHLMALFFGFAGTVIVAIRDHDILANAHTMQSTQMEVRARQARWKNACLNTYE